MPGLDLQTATGPHASSRCRTARSRCS
jgi:hypothetical protein